MSSKPRLFLIDGNNQMYRAYHAIHGLTGPDGRSTNAVYGFITMLRKLITDHQPDLVAAAFDLKGLRGRRYRILRLRLEPQRRHLSGGPRTVLIASRSGQTQSATRA